MKRNLIALLGLMIVTPALALGVAAPAEASDGVDCIDFHPDHSGYVGQPSAQRFYEANNPAQDPYNLDGDRDGYACEALAKDSPVGTEPDCYKTGVPGFQTTHCAGRNQYRTVFWLTSKKRVGDVKRAMLDTYAPQAKDRAWLQSYLENAYGLSTASGAACERTAMLGFIRKQNDAEKTSSAFVQLFGTGQKVVSKVDPGPNPVPDLINEYLKLGGTLADTARDIGVALAARNYLIESVTCEA